MISKEFENRDEYIAFVNDATISPRIRSIYLYWYEGKGQRKNKVLAGRHVAAYWEGLSLKDQVRQSFDMPLKLREAFHKDYEEKGAMTELEGNPEDAVIVVEYE